MKGLQASLYNIKLLQLGAALPSTEISKTLSALSIFLGWDPGGGRRDGGFCGHCLPGWLPASFTRPLASHGSGSAAAPRSIRPALPGAGEGSGILLSRGRMLLCLTFNAVLAPAGCKADLFI